MFSKTISTPVDKIVTHEAPASVPPHLFTITKPTFLTVFVSPEAAMEWLQRNDGNRRHREPLVRQYADDMANGRWTFTAEAIQFSTKGRLINGQHRLKAILRSQTTHKMLVAFGIDDDAQHVLDTGARRTASDTLSLAGFTHTAAGAAVAKLAYNEKTEGRYYTYSEMRPSSKALLDLALVDPKLMEAGARAQSTLPRHLLAPSVLGYTWWRLDQVDEEANTDFWRKLDTLENLGAGHPILALSKRLVSHRLSGKGARSLAQQVELISFVFQGWNAWRRNEERAILKVSRTEDGRLRAPHPV